MEVIISIWRMGASILKLILIRSIWDYTTFHSFFSTNNISSMELLSDSTAKSSDMQ